jgi:hypothetical protein
VFAEPDPANQLARYAALVVAIDRRISAIWRALEGAAASDPEAGRLYVSMVRQRRGVNAGGTAVRGRWRAAAGRRCQYCGGPDVAVQRSVVV